MLKYQKNSSCIIIIKMTPIPYTVTKQVNQYVRYLLLTLKYL